MNSINILQPYRMKLQILRRSLLLLASLAVLAARSLLASEPGGSGFAAPQEAVTALHQALTAKDVNKLRAIFGPRLDDIINPDAVEATNEFVTVVRAMDESNRLIDSGADRKILEYGNDKNLFPVPLVKRRDQWFFDTAAGKEE